MTNIQPSAEARIDLPGMLPEELSLLVADMGEPAYRADQLFSWIHEKDTPEISAMTDLPATFREELARRTNGIGLKRISERQSTKDGTAKFLFEVAGAGFVESVLIREGGRRTACLSSQVGCPLDCKFCATGRMGLKANLSAAQILDQLRHLNQHAMAEGGERVTNVVMMGMGEPLLNYDNLVRALRLMKLKGKSGIGGRRITVSTAGYVPGIRKLMDEDLNVGLAISLNATTDASREQIMPINRKFKIDSLLAAAKDYFDKRGRRVTLEYVLLDRLNDTDDDARRLSQLTRGLTCKINLIPYNELSLGSEGADVPTFRRPPRQRVDQFTQLLQRLSKNTITLRESKGRDIDAACGQLFHEKGPLVTAPDKER